MAAVAPWPAAASAEWRWPVDGAVVTSFANGGGPYAAGQHRGIDVAARPGAAVVAASGGTVRFAGEVGSSGLTVSIRTADGRFDVSYLHLEAIAVAEGAAVPAGARIGTAGTSGRPSSATPHLHLGVREAGTRRYRDPLTLLPPRPSVRDLPRGAPAPVRVPARSVPGAVRVPPPLPASAPALDRRGWAVACAALLAAAALLGAGTRRVRRTLRHAIPARLAASARLAGAARASEESRSGAPEQSR